MTSLLIVLLVVVVLAALSAPAVLVGRHHRRPAPWSAEDRIGVAPDAFDEDRAAHAG